MTVTLSAQIDDGLIALIPRLPTTLAPRLDQLAAAADDLATTSTAADLPADNSMLADILAEHHATWEVRLFAS